MPADLPRRRFLADSLACAALIALPSAHARATSGAAEARIAALERRHGGRLGVAVLDVAGGHRIGHRDDERFPMCSTFKFLAAAQVLARVDRGSEHLDRRVTYEREALVPYSPVTGERVGAPGMSIAELCEAAITVSDNTAANLLLESFGGPEALTAFARTLGDRMTRLDRTEPTLNEAIPGDPRDTTTPSAMLANLDALLLGDALSAGSRRTLREWLMANTTGARRLRAGLPADWRIGDKTGSSNHGVTNDIGIAWSPRGGPVLIAAYYAEAKGDDDVRSAVLADVARIVADWSDGHVPEAQG